MKHIRPDNVKAASRLVSRLAAEKNKTIVAVCLITLMGFMWVRLLTKKQTPTAVDAAAFAQSAPSSEQAGSDVRVCFVELPEIKGRNDVLLRDFFSANGWEGFIRDEDGENSYEAEVRMTVKDDTEGHHRRRTILRIAKSLRLNVIELSERPQAFINETLVSVGGKLPVGDKGKSYEFTVVEIDEEEVVLTCEGVKIEVKLQPGETTN